LGSFGSEEAAAKVNGVTITKDQVYEALLAYDGGQTISGLIDAELIKQAAAEAGITVTDADIELAMESIRSQFPSEVEFLSALAMYGMTLEDLKSDMQLQAKMRKLLEPQVSVTDEDIKAYYEANAEMMGEPEQVKAAHILVKTKEEAVAIRLQLTEGADFAELVSEKTLDTATIESGGELGFFERGVMEGTFDTAAFSLEVGQLSEPIETSYGFHIIKVLEKKAAYIPTLEDKREDIQESLVSEQISTMSTVWLEELRANADIEDNMTM
jgi:foldase protein PrsA